jgi:membrane associated rhomboid family serine protease
VRLVGPPGWRRIPPVTRGTLLVAAIGYLVALWNVLSIPSSLVLMPGAVAGGQVWRLLTYPAVSAGILTVLFDLLLLWSFGSELEPSWGSRSYLLFLLLATATAGAVGAGSALLLGSPFGSAFGFAAPLTAVIFAWMLEAPGAPTNFFGILPMPRTGFALIAAIFVVFGEIETTHSLSRVLFVLGGIPAAWYWVRFRRRRRYAASFSTRDPRPSRLFKRRRFRVVRPEDERIH